MSIVKKLHVAVAIGLAAIGSGLSTVGAQENQAAASPAVPQMRTRILTSLTGYEVADYLKRNDVIFIPVGPTEVNGGNPMDVEYVIPLAYALKMADKSDGLVMPYLAYFYPGSTTVSPGTVMVTPEEGIAYLRVITTSLVRQGFRRIVFLTSHGPSGDTLGPLVREVFDETHVPVVWMDTSVIATGGREHQSASAGAKPGASPDFAAAMNQRRLITYGAYLAVGRLQDLPLNFAVPHHQFEADKGMASLSRHLIPGRSDVGRFYADPSEHGGWPTAVTSQQREQWGKEGLSLIESQVAAYDLNGMLDALRQHDQFTKAMEKEFGDRLPPDRRNLEAAFPPVHARTTEQLNKPSNFMIQESAQPATARTE